jgi:hypothetical protein
MELCTTFQSDSKGQVDDYEGSCAMTLVTTDVDKLARPANADAVKKYFVKNTKKEKLDKPQT